MSLGTPAVNLHSPGPIGDVTPATLAGTTLVLTSTVAQQIIINYGGANLGSLTVNSNGQFIFNAAGGAPGTIFQIAGTTVAELTNIGILADGTNACYSFNGKSNVANRALFCVAGLPAFGGTSGVGDGGADHRVTLVANQTDIIICDQTLITATVPVTVPGGTNPLLTTSAAITSGAGSGAGTLTNAPSVGNPTAWIPISDHGTTRYFPAW